MLDFLTMEQSLGFSLDDYTYAEASQMFCEHGRDKWQHTAAILAQIAAANADPKNPKKIRPEEFNPWENMAGGGQRGIPLTRENLHILKGWATNGKVSG